MEYTKTFNEYLNEASKSKTIKLFRGQSGKFYNAKHITGYQKSFKMLFMSDDIDNALFYTYSGREQIREILVFEVPDNIAKVEGVYIDRLGTDKIEQLKKDGYSGVTSNRGEFMADKGEVGMFQNYTPILSIKTTNGKFSDKDIKKLKKLGLSDYEVKIEKNLIIKV